MRGLLLLFCFSPLVLWAQTAPDFTVTDSDGVEHTLYADYLDQGKSVLIKIFFTTCPPCRSLAPSMDIYYQQWGGGDHDVEFFELSDKSFDTDALVEAYTVEFGITFPSAGAEGGSLDAVTPYKDGTYGPFFGTPTFVVIAPDGTVQYDVDGGPTIWDALDEALYATGALKPGDDPDPPDPPDPPEPVDFEGNVRTFNSVGIADVIVALEMENGVEIARDTTDLTGSYAFSLDSALVADTTLYVNVFKSINPTNGITAIDLVLIQKHLLGIDPFTDVKQLLASDANDSGTLSALDLLVLQRLLLGKDPNFSSGDTWLFYPQELNLGPATGDPPQLNIDPVSVQNIVAGTQSPDFKGLKRGDVNNTASPGS